MKEITTSELNDLCKKVRHLTDINDHTGAKKIVCAKLGYEDLHAVLCEVERLHDISGSLSIELSAIRRKIGKVMLKNIYSDYCENVYQSIKNAY